MQANLQSLVDTPAYRLMVLRTNATVAAIWKLDARDDDEAIAAAKAVGGTSIIELWDGLRFIEQFNVIHTAS